MIPQIYVDLDGVLSDFDSHYEALFGVRPNQDTYEPPDLWDNVRAHGRFYETQPLMKDAHKLWDAIKQFHPNPVILTGVPYSIPDAAYQKGKWRDNHFPGVRMICCKSTDKYLWGKRGDILIDDRLKYSKYWIEMGGIFLHHTSISRTLSLLPNAFYAGQRHR